MPIEQKRGWCQTCEDYRLFSRHQFGNGNGCLLTLVTGTFFLPFWFMFRVADGFKPFLCQICGDKPAWRLGRKRKSQPQVAPQVTVVTNVIVQGGPPPSSKPSQLGGVIHSKVAGVTQTNPDGVPRQEIAKRCRPGLVLIARPEPDNSFDENAIGLWVKGKGQEIQLGYVNADVAADLAGAIEGGKELKVEVTAVTGGVDGKNFGVNIVIATVAASPAQIAARPPKPSRPPIDYRAIAAGAWRSLVDLKTSVGETYGRLPEWARPIVLGLACVSPVITAMFAIRFAMSL